VDVSKPQIAPTGLSLTSQAASPRDRPGWIEVMLDLSYLALATDLTRVITFEWSREANGFGGSGEFHHSLSHHGGDPEMLTKLAAVDRFYLGCLNRFLTLLKSTGEEGGNLLDHTTVIYGSGMNNGDRGGHSQKNLPLLVAGGTAWGLKHGQHLAHDPEKHPPLCNVLLTTIQKMGVETDKFQEATGTLTGLV
jgi:hypothetical protein